MKGTLICNGGGDANQTQAADALFRSLLPNKHFLFIPAFLKTGRAVMGMSAGSILMGKSIEVAQIGPPNQADENLVGLTDFSGLNLANGHTLYTHYRPEEDEQLHDYAKRTGEIILGIPEESAIVVKGGEMREVGEIKKTTELA